MNAFYAIGHSNRSLVEFTQLLGDVGIDLLVDIRTVPRSRANPQFNKDTLPAALAPFHISYEHMATLGGRRGKARTVSPDVNAFWTNDSFHNYADYALSSDFHAGLEQLIEQGHERRCVMMCSEAVWWRCHRRIVADHLIAHGESVCHIMGSSRLQPARLTAGAIIQPDRTVIYPGASPAGS
ncbi:MAG TPA: DUF488 domain-containing protein [Steroidobacteraceae bacterium]|nr:DUF488 domain-containing protein [Steroidobacteraceae bacterium]